MTISKRSTYSKAIGVRFMKDEYATIKKAAKYTNSRSVSDFIRKHLAHYIETILMPKKR